MSPSKRAMIALSPCKRGVDRADKHFLCNNQNSCLVLQLISCSLDMRYATTMKMEEEEEERGLHQPCPTFCP